MPEASAQTTESSIPDDARLDALETPPGTAPVITSNGGGPTASVSIDEGLTSGLSSNVKDRVTVYMKNGKVAFAYNNAGTINYLTIPLDGSRVIYASNQGGAAIRPYIVATGK